MAQLYLDMTPDAIKLNEMTAFIAPKVKYEMHWYTKIGCNKRDSKAEILGKNYFLLVTIAAEVLEGEILLDNCISIQNIVFRYHMKYLKANQNNTKPYVKKQSNSHHVTFYW